MESLLDDLATLLDKVQSKVKLLGVLKHFKLLTDKVGNP